MLSSRSILRVVSGAVSASSLCNGYAPVTAPANPGGVDHTIDAGVYIPQALLTSTPPTPNAYQAGPCAHQAHPSQHKDEPAGQDRYSRPVGDDLPRCPARRYGRGSRVREPEASRQATLTNRLTNRRSARLPSEVAGADGQTTGAVTALFGDPPVERAGVGDPSVPPFVQVGLVGVKDARVGRRGVRPGVPPRPQRGRSGARSPWPTAALA